MHPLWATFAVALAIALALTPLARWAALRLGVVDRPDGRRKLHKQPVPLLGGVALYLALVTGLFIAHRFAGGISAQLSELSGAIIAAAGFVCLIGCVDDICDLKPRVKLLLQIVSVTPVVVAGYYVDRVVAFGVPIELGWLGVPITVAWLVGCINALNLLDGMDGLAGTVGLSTSLMMAVLASSSGHPHVAIVAIVLAGALAGFLIYNLPPASIYLGDSGSMIIGLVIGILSIQAALKTSATLSLTAPAVALTIPMLDTALAIVRRRLSGLRFDAADRGHIHHQLLNRGLSNWQALCIIGALCLTTGAAATAATLLSFDALGWIIVLAVIVTLVRTRAFGHHEVALVKLSLAAALTRFVQSLLDSARPMARRAKHPSFEFDWQALADEAAHWNIGRLELVIEGSAAPSVRRHWSNPADDADQSSGWSYSMRFDHGDRRCDLVASGRLDGRNEPWHLIRIARLLNHFGKYWVAHAHEIDGSAQPNRTLPLTAAPQSRAA